MAVTFTQARKSSCNLGILVSFSGGFAPLDTSGLMPFDGTLTFIGNGNGICWGKEVTVSVEGASGFLPKLYVKSVTPYDLKTGETSVNVGCAISLLANKTFDDFKDEKEFLINPDDPLSIPKKLPWWMQWEVIGTKADPEHPEYDPEIILEVPIQEIINEMCRQLRLSTGGGVSGKKRLPYTPSGNVLSEIGNLLFHSESPSYMYCDPGGVAKITRILQVSGGMSVTLGESGLDKDFNPIDGGVEPLKRLIVTYTTQQFDPLNSCDKTVQRCYTSSMSLPGLTITGDANDQYELTVEQDTVCEWVTCGVSGSAVGVFSQNECNVKAIEIKKKARPEYLFPGYKPGVLGPNFVDSYYELSNQYYDAEDGLLMGEATLIQEPVGIVYSGWINSHENWEIEEAGGTGSSINDFPNNIAIGLGAVYPATLPTGRAGHPRNKYNTTLTNSSYTETKYFYDEDLVMTGKVTTTWMPISKALPDFNGNSFNGYGTAKVEFDAPQGSQVTIEILEKEQWVDLSSITGVPDIQNLTGKIATFLIYGEGDGRGTKAFSGETVITSIVTETWDYSCSGASRHTVEEKVLKYEYASEIESNLQAKYAEPINAILNIVTYKNGQPTSESKSTISTETPTGFMTVPMWGTRQQAFEEYLRREGIDEYPSVSTGTPIPADWVLADGSDPDGYILMYNSDTIIPNFIPRSDLLKLVTKRTITNSSAGGGESPASSEFLTCSITENVANNIKDVLGVIELEGFLCTTGKYEPPTEVIDLGLVYDVSWARKMARLIMELRQAQSIQYELIGTIDLASFPPVQGITVIDNCRGGGVISGIGTGMGIVIGSDEIVCTWDIWATGGGGGVSSSGTNYSIPSGNYVVTPPSGDDPGIVIAPPPQYVIAPNDYSGNGVFTIQVEVANPNYVSVAQPDNTEVTVITSTGDTLTGTVVNGQVEVGTTVTGNVDIIVGTDTLSGTVTEVPPSIVNDTIQGNIINQPSYVEVSPTINNTSVMVIAGDETLNTWVSDGKIEVPDTYTGNVIVIAGDDTLTETVINPPDRIEIPRGYYPNDNIYLDDTLPATLTSDDTIPTYITNPVIINGDDTLIGFWPIVIGTGGIARLKLNRTDFLSYGRDSRTFMIRG